VEWLRRTSKNRIKLSIRVDTGGGDVSGSRAGGYTEEAASRLGLKSQTYQHPDTQMGVYCIFPRNGYNGCRESTQLFSINSDISNPKEEPMKRKFLFVTIGVVAMLLVTAFLAGKAFATTGCFTDTVGNFAETAICWLKDKGIAVGYGGGLYGPNDYVTRAQMAVYMKNLAAVVPDTGVIMITPGNAEWLKRSESDDLSFENAGYQTNITKTTAGIAWITVQPSIPTVLYGRQLQLLGVELCYVASANAKLESVDLDTFTSTNGTVGTYTAQASDSTERTDTACRWYALASPYTLTENNGVVFYAHVNWTAGGIFYITRTTFELQPKPFTP
jgi:hypothetical protein